MALRDLVATSKNGWYVCGLLTKGITPDNKIAFLEDQYLIKANTIEEAYEKALCLPATKTDSYAGISFLLPSFDAPGDLALLSSNDYVEPLKSPQPKSKEELMFK